MSKASGTYNRSKATLRDVAEAADCSVALASHVLNKSYGNITCTEELRLKIERVAEELGYASMRSKHLPIFFRSYNVGVNVAGVEQSEVLVKTIAEIEKYANSVGYTLIIFGYSATPEEAVDFFKKKIKQSQIDILVDLSNVSTPQLSALTDNFIASGVDVTQRFVRMLSGL
ncbi:MAG: LacI family DNA-binding transcriptional regulator [Kiritimatiellae bacterium]|nr:LacI family DNA-binding transcriptional regulator [Kiritimatiellia bacterium]